MYGRTDGRTDKVNPVYPPSNFVGRGYNQYTPPPTSLGGGIDMTESKPQQNTTKWVLCAYWNVLNSSFWCFFLNHKYLYRSWVCFISIAQICIGKKYLCQSITILLEVWSYRFEAAGFILIKLYHAGIYQIILSYVWFQHIILRR